MGIGPEGIVQSIYTGNPLVLMELRRRLRKPATFVVLLAPVLLISVIFYYEMLLSGRSLFTLLFGSFAGPGMRMTLQEVGRKVFEEIAFGYMWISLLTIPAVTAGSICRERELGTLEMLRLSSLSGAGIVGGKIAGGLIYVGLLLLSTAPILFVARLFGGLASSEIVLGIFLSLSWALAFGLLSLFVSSLMEKTRSALVVSYGVLFIWLWLSHKATYLEPILRPVWTGVVARYPAMGDTFGQTTLELLSELRGVFNPLVAMSRTFSDYGFERELFGWPTWLLSSAFAGVISILFGGLALAALRFSRGVKHLFGSAMRKRVRRVATIVGSRRNLLTDKRNAILQKELRTTWTGTATCILAVFLGGAFLAAGTTMLPTFDAIIFAQVLSLSLILLCVLVAGCVSGSLSVITERENGTLLALRMSELTPRDIIMGKFWSSYWSSMLLSIAALPLVLGMLATDAASGGWAFLWFSLVLLNAAVGTSLGVSISVGAKRAATSVMGSVISFVVWGFVIYQVGGMIVGLILMLLLAAGGLLLEPLFGVTPDDILAGFPGSPTADQFAGVVMLVFGVLTILAVVVLSCLMFLRSSTNSLAIRLGRQSRGRKSVKARPSGDWDEEWASMGKRQVNTGQKPEVTPAHPTNSQTASPRLFEGEQ